jgi:outer membrane protein assembly factor BamB
MRRLISPLLLSLLLAGGQWSGSLALPAAAADDWPQWMGPDRDNTWKETEVLTQLPEGGPNVLWRQSLAGGYAGPAVADGRVFVTDYVTADDVQVPNFERKQFTGIERVHCLDQASGETLWKHEYPVKYTVSYPAGPRCTPLVDGERVYTLGTEGDLICFQAATGEIVWSRNLPQDYNAKTPLWGYAGHPLIDGEKLITLAGGSGTHAVALDKLTGKEIWRTLTSREQGYSPPTIIEAGGVRQLILARPDGVSGVNPETGEPYWTEPYEATNGSIIMSPVKAGEYLYIAGYSNKNLMLKLAADEPAVEYLWQDEPKTGISPVNVQPIVDGKTIYGYDQSGQMIAMDVPSGERLWTSTAAIGGRASGTDTAFIVRQGDRYFLFTEKGDLVIAELSRSGYREIDRTHLIEPTGVAFGRAVVWSAPAFAGRSIFVRNDKEVVAFDLSAE